MGSVTGKCLCGAVRFTANPEHTNVTTCHCSMCRNWSAGPFFAIDCTAVKIDDRSNLGTYESSEWGERSFCKKCGTPLFYHLKGKDFYAVSAEALDDKSKLSLGHQIFIDEKPAYYDFKNETKNMTGAELFAQFTGSKE
jgi:hypothetical protein